MSLFQKSVINKYLSNQDQEELSTAYNKYQEFYGDTERLENIKLLKEENYQEGFLREIFVQVLGYTINPDKNYNLTTEYKNQTDAKKADGAILREQDAIGVIELKSTKTVNLDSIIEQAFNYKNHQSKCKYVITSNFEKLNFYIDNATEWEEFNLFALTEKDFALFYLLLNHKNLLNDVPLQIKKESRLHEENISDKFYKDYSQFKHKIYNNLVKNNPQYDKLVLFKKSQKLLDRVLFILFAEDSGLVPPNAISKIVDQYEQLKELDEEQTLYSRFIKFFHHLNVGHEYKTYSLPAYNGGLFKEDEILDNVHIDDEILLDDMLHLSSYDFSTEVDVNILGHIFEHSLTEIEEITAELEGTLVEREKSKRKKDGIFYTPKYITKYIVDNTIGALCNEKKKELNLNEIDEQILENSKTKRGSLTAKAEKIFNNLDKYREYILSLKILDPACGSGAFLNQALDFLINEHKWIDEHKASLLKEAFTISEYEKETVENNIYGVDINEEAVEIAKLSLWLRTAKKGRKLSTLSDNIKCGNSLIDDSEVAGDKAFNWDEEFKEIMQNGGFDVVIGNPPYGAKFNDEELNYFSTNFQFQQYQLDSYLLFLEKINVLLKNNCYCGYIIPNTWLTNLFSSEIRKYILQEFRLTQLVHFNNKVFKDATVDTDIFVLNKSSDNINDNQILVIINDGQRIITEHKTKQIKWIEKNGKPINIFQTDKFDSILEKVNKTDKLDQIAKIVQGVKPFQKGKGKPPQTKETMVEKPFVSEYKKDETFVPLLRGSLIHRYKTLWDQNYWISYGDWLAEPRHSAKFDYPEKILIRQTGDSLVATFDDEKFIVRDNMYIIWLENERINTKSLLAIINSSFMNWYYQNILNSEKGEALAQVKRGHLSELPIQNLGLEIQKIFNKKVDIILRLNNQLQESVNKFIHRIKDNFELEKISPKLQSFYDYDFKQFRSELKKQKVTLTLKQQDEWEDYFNEYKTKINQLQEQITKTDNEIDVMVYKLYNLTYQEVKIVDPNFFLSEDEYNHYKL